MTVHDPKDCSYDICCLACEESRFGLSKTRRGLVEQIYMLCSGQIRSHHCDSDPVFEHADDDTSHELAQAKPFRHLFQQVRNRIVCDIPI